MEPTSQTLRPTHVMWLRIGAICAIGVLVTACGGSGIADPVASSSLPVSCSSVTLSITMITRGTQQTRDTVRVVNTGNQPCTLAGVHPVEVPWSSIIGPGPSPVAGILSPGSALVQSYKPLYSNSCPPPAEGSPAQIGITVEGHIYDVDLPAQLVHAVTGCWTVSVLPPTIQPPTHAAS